MGGLAIFLGFVLSVVLFAQISKPVQGILIGTIVIVITGAVDDVVSLPAWLKLLLQFAAAGIAVAHGVIIEMLMNPIAFSHNEGVVLGALAVPITLLWIVGITNSVNLIDGLDGLAVGVSAISSVTILIVSLLVSEPNVALVLAALTGACLGFMPYNMNPAKIFMGDTGALLLGFVLSTISVVGLFKFYALVTFAVPFLALAVPLAGPRPFSPPPYRYGPVPEAGRDPALCRQRLFGSGRRGAGRQRTDARPAADRHLPLCRDCLVLCLSRSALPAPDKPAGPADCE
jgi:UDP-GlcNAc:undecaprenyl-phosphate GlcNAc-1-phosphate transferase